MEFLRIFEAEQFQQVVVSMKASNVRVVIDSTRLLTQRMERENMHYPLHLGVTEAGEGIDGRIKSALGIGVLLQEGIGDTVRVSLTEPPEVEIPVAKRIVAYSMASAKPEFQTVSDHDNAVGIKEGQVPATHSVLKKTYPDKDIEDIFVKATCDFAAPLLNEVCEGICIETAYPGKGEEIALSLLQACRLRISKPEYISCPSCGRTLFDLQSAAAKIRAKTIHLKGLKIAIMGCIVNGPGEMADADYGYVGAAAGKITLYRKREVVKRNIPEEHAVDELIALIQANGDWTATS
jgi:(E)-4-hydroxy-3-methylbut-2-enyl-diphosphate synthase